MSKVAVDIDDTLYDFNELAQEMITKVAIKEDDKEMQKGAYSAWNEWRAPKDAVDAKFWLSIIDMCHEDHLIRSQMPFKHSVTVLRKIASAGHEIVYISNRADSTYDATKEWLISHGFPQPASLICTSEDKAPLIADCQYLIDDRPKTLVEFTYDYEWKNENLFTGRDRVAFGLFCEYNRALTDVPRIYLAPNWALLEKYIEEKSDLLNG